MESVGNGVFLSTFEWKIIFALSFNISIHLHLQGEKYREKCYEYVMGWQINLYI